MYRSLGTRGSVFGVPTGPYAGKERTLSFTRLPDASKRRLIDALSGKGTLSPILRPGAPRRSLRVLFVALLGVGLYGLFAARWPAQQGLAFAACDVVVASVLAWTVRGARRTLSFDGTTILAGTYLFPLDVVEASVGGVLRLFPLGKVREAAVAIVASRPSLVLTFDDGNTRAFGVDSPRQAEAAFAAMEAAQKTLEKLTYNQDLDAAVHLDPFFEVRMDGSWQSVAPATRNHERVSAAVALGIGVVLGLSLFGVRHLVGTRAAQVATERLLTRERAELERVAELNAPRRTKDIAHKADAELLPNERVAREEQRKHALSVFHERAKSPQIAELVDSLVASVAQRGGGVKMYVTHTCAGPSGCGPYEQELRNYEDRVARTFQSVFSEAVPRGALAFDLTREQPGAEMAYLTVGTVVTRRGEDAGTHEITMRFDVRFRAPGRTEPAPFTLTMPPPKAPLISLRDRSIFTHAENGGAESLVFARGFDRLYDELYGLFFAGAPRVPLHDSHGDAEAEDAAEKLRDTFGIH